MSELDLQGLLAEISPNAPCGEDLSADPAYGELERLALGTPERQIGATIVPAQEPDWNQLNRRCTELLGRTKDLRVLVYVTLAQLKLRGPAGLRDGLGLLRGVLERYWEHVHPKLDPDDDLDPLERLNILASLATPPGSYGDPIMLERRLRETPLTRSPRLGRFSLRDMAIAKGDIKVPDDLNKPKPVPGVIDAAFEDTPIEDLRALADAAEGAIAQLRGIGAVLTERVGEGRAVDLNRVLATLNEMRTQVQRPLDKRGGAPPPRPASGGIGSSGAGAHVAGAGMTSTTAGPFPASPPSSVGVPGEIQSKEDVMQALEKVCQYYERFEPSSPIPLLLKGAQRLVSKNFMEIMKCLTPDALSHLTKISGLDDESGGS